MKRKDYDLARQKVIENTGIKVSRFNNSEIYDHPEDVLIKIMQAVSDPALSTKWRGGTPSIARGG